jgi:hypothetical protein
VSTSHDPANRCNHRYATIPEAGSLVHSAGRHPTLATIEDLLHAVTCGAAASAIGPIEEPTALVSLPTVLWLRGPDDHPKARRGLLPYPINWSSHPLVPLTPGTTLEVSWNVRTWGQRLSGSTRLVVDGSDMVGRALSQVRADDLLDATLGARTFPASSTDRAERLRRTTVDEGSLARWRLHEFLEPWLRRSMTAAHRAVAAELRVPRVLDDIALEDLFTELLLGEGGRHGLVDKVISRLATPALPRPNVDAARYIVTTFRRDAELALRRRIDDPRWVGPALRRFAANHPDLQGGDLVEAYNASSCTSERIGMDRAMRALNPAVQPTAVHVPIEFVAARSEPHAEDVFLVAIVDTGGPGGRTRSHAARPPHALTA